MNINLEDIIKIEKSNEYVIEIEAADIKELHKRCKIYQNKIDILLAYKRDIKKTKLELQDSQDI